jgi:hypothetical protein
MQTNPRRSDHTSPGSHPGTNNPMEANMLNRYPHASADGALDWAHRFHPQSPDYDDWQGDFADHIAHLSDEDLAEDYGMWDPDDCRVPSRAPTYTAMYKEEFNRRAMAAENDQTA